MKNYPSKVILAWSEAVNGNEPITKWLISNGYPELISCLDSFRGNENADKRLMKSGHPEFVAFVEFINGSKKAKEWLEQFGFDLFITIGDFVNEEDGSAKKLMATGAKEVIIFAQRLKKFVTEIDFDANDVHKSPFR